MFSSLLLTVLNAVWMVDYHWVYSSSSPLHGLGFPISWLVLAVETRTKYGAHRMNVSYQGWFSTQSRCSGGELKYAAVHVMFSAQGRLPRLEILTCHAPNRGIFTQVYQSSFT
ncbi:hypothetical protein BX600DRAFT_460685 [Xylariales sp. PMI_506]|nr:hypothetical protein BX600DRAFT_460685 [Xylariales sp. PMI_506]